jgi:L-malate glycosyltransferase
MLVGAATSVHIRRLAAGFVGRGLTVLLATFDGEKPPGVTVSRLGTLSADHDIRYPLAIPSLARLIRQSRPRVINAHYVTSFGVMTAAASLLAHPMGKRPPVIQTAWGDDLLSSAKESPVRRGYARLALGTATMATGDSLELEAAAREIAPGLRWHRFVFGPTASLLEAPARKERVVLSARQLLPNMRVDLIVRAFLTASQSPISPIAGWRLDVAGSGPEASAISRLAEGRENVRIIGWQDYDVLSSQLLSATIVVSVPVSDGTSATLLESLAAGAIPVVNDLPANREWVTQDIGEIVARDPSVEELAAALQRAASRQVEVARIRMAVAESTWEAELDRLTNMIDAIGGGT